MSIEIKLLNVGDADVLTNVEPGTFNDPIDPRGTQEFLNDPRHHLAVAISDDKVVGLVSAVHYSHPDMRYPEMWINEVQVAPPHRRQGLAKALLNRRCFSLDAISNVLKHGSSQDKITLLPLACTRLLVVRLAHQV